MQKITIMTACYNGENYIKPHLDSILNQTHTNIEYILVNDGSTDKTESIIKEYQALLEKRNISFKYITKENGGQASAINKALPEVTGEFVAQIDSDDIILPTFLEDLSKFLIENPQYDFCVPKIGFVKEKNLNKYTKFQQRKVKNPTFDTLFYDELTDKKNLPHSSFVLYKTSSLFNVLLGGQISEKCQSQIPGLFFPMIYTYKCGYVDKLLAKYVIRKNSHCHQSENIDFKINDWERSALEAIKRLKTDEYEKQFAYNLIKYRYLNYRKRMQGK